MLLEVMESFEIELRGIKHRLEPAVYIYVGSARGPGGALARVLRHLSRDKKTRWHVDKLTESHFVTFLGFYLINAHGEDCEVSISLRLSSVFKYIPKFGSTDKRESPSHLFKCPSTPEECASVVYEVLENARGVLDFVYVDLRELS